MNLWIHQEMDGSGYRHGDLPLPPQSTVAAAVALTVRALQAPRRAAPGPTTAAVAPHGAGAPGPSEGGPGSHGQLLFSRCAQSDA